MSASGKKKGAGGKKSAGRKSKAELVSVVIEQVEQRLVKGDLKPTVGDLIRLYQVEKELQEEQPQEIKVSWVEPGEKDNASEK